MVRAAALLAVLAAALPGAASASQLIDRNASGVRLEVNRAGQALLTYRIGGRLKHVLVWGAVDARPPSATVPQFEFRVDYAGGWGAFRRLVWKDFRNACKPYTGPPVAMLVTACTAPDGSYWGVQTWQRGLPDLGFGINSALAIAVACIALAGWPGPIVIGWKGCIERMRFGIDPFEECFYFAGE